MVISNNHFGCKWLYQNNSFGSKWFYYILTTSFQVGFVLSNNQCLQVLVICDKSRENVVFTYKYSNHGKCVAFFGVNNFFYKWRPIAFSMLQHLLKHKSMSTRNFYFFGVAQKLLGRWVSAYRRSILMRTQSTQVDGRNIFHKTCCWSN